jgi:hypothetical protein
VEDSSEFSFVKPSSLSLQGLISPNFWKKLLIPDRFVNSCFTSLVYKKKVTGTIRQNLVNVLWMSFSSLSSDVMIALMVVLKITNHRQLVNQTVPSGAWHWQFDGLMRNNEKTKSHTRIGIEVPAKCSLPCRKLLEPEDIFVDSANSTWYLAFEFDFPNRFSCSWSYNARHLTIGHSVSLINWASGELSFLAWQRQNPHSMLLPEFFRTSVSTWFTVDYRSSLAKLLSLILKWISSEF